MHTCPILVLFRYQETAPSPIQEGEGPGDEEEKESSNEIQREGNSDSSSKNEKNGDDQKVEKGKDNIILATLDSEKIQLDSIGGGEKGSEPESLQEQDGGGAAQEEVTSKAGLSSRTEQGTVATAAIGGYIATSWGSFRKTPKGGKNTSEDILGGWGACV